MTEAVNGLEDLQKRIEAIKKQKELLDARKALLESEKAFKGAEQTEAMKKQKEMLDAEKAVLDSQKALEGAKQPVDLNIKTLQDQLALVKAQKEIADAEKAGADAGKAKSEADLAAFRARWGEVTQSGYAGGIEVKEKAGQLEAFLLASHAVIEACKKIEGRVRAVLPANRAPITIYALGEFPTFQNLIMFNAQIGVIQNAMAAAIEESKAILGEPRHLEAMAMQAPVLAAAGLALDSVNKLASFFRTDHTVGGFEMNLEDATIVFEIAKLLSNECGGVRYTVRVPAVYDPSAIEHVEGLLKKFTELSLLNQHLFDRIRQHEQAAKQAEAGVAATHSKCAESLRRTTELYEGWFTKLTTSDDKKAFPLAVLIKEAAAHKALAAGSAVLLLKIQKAGGGYVTKKNLWSFFGGIPLYHSGGVSVTYALLDGREGHVLEGGVIPVQGGLVRANKLREYLNTDVQSP